MGGFSLENAQTEADVMKARFDYLRKENILSCDLLKIDCEGCEVRLLNDSRLLDFLHPDEIMVEYHCGNNDLIMNTIRKKNHNVVRIHFTHAPDYGIIYANHLQLI